MVNLAIFFSPHRNSTIYDTLFLVNSVLLTYYLISISLSITAHMPSFLKAVFDQIPLQNYVEKNQISCPNQSVLQIDC